MGELSRARQRLAGNGLAPGTSDTLACLRDPSRRPVHREHPIPEDVRNFQPARPVRLEPGLLLRNLRSAPRESAPGLLGTRSEHLKVILDEEACSDMFVSICERLAQRRVSAAVARALGGGRLTALLKPPAGVRGIVAGDRLRCLVSRTLSQQFSEEVETATQPFQFALSTRAGTDAADILLRSISEMDPETVIVCVDGVGGVR